MATIEERAKSHYQVGTHRGFKREEAYILGATEQKQIDIEKAISLIKMIAEQLYENGNIGENTLLALKSEDDIRKAMEE